jgi:hypothetical protein
MRRIALETDNPANYHDMFKILWKRLTDFHHIKHVHKSLLLTDYMLRYGPERFVSDMRLRSDVLRKLCFYKYYKNGVESGSDVRGKAKAILTLLDDKELLHEQRQAAASTNQKIIGFSYRDTRVDSVSHKQPRGRSNSTPVVEAKMIVDCDSPADSPLSMAEEKSPEPRKVSPVRARAKSVIPARHEEDDLLSFARSNRKNSVDIFEESGIFSFDMPEEKQSRSLVLFDESFLPAQNQMALVPMVPHNDVSLFDVGHNDVSLFDEVDLVAPVEVEEQKPVDLMEMEVEHNEDVIPEDLWAFANVDDIRVTNSEKKRREYAMKKKMMMKGQKLNQMEAKHKMEFDSAPFTNVNAQSNAVVPYGMQFQQGYYQQVVPYSYPNAQSQAELHWN